MFLGSDVRVHGGYGVQQLTGSYGPDVSYRGVQVAEALTVSAYHTHLP